MCAVCNNASAIAPKFFTFSHEESFRDVHCFLNCEIHSFSRWQHVGKVLCVLLGKFVLQGISKAGFHEPSQDLHLNLLVVCLYVTENPIVPFKGKEPAGIQWPILLNHLCDMHLHVHIWCHCSWSKQTSNPFSQFL